MKKASWVLAGSMLLSTVAVSAFTAQQFWQAIIGQPDANKLYLGMFAWHFNPNSQRKDNNVNNLVGVIHNGLFLGGFSNSYGKFTVGFGAQRNWVERPIGMSNWRYALGYKAGAMVGYDNRLCKYCGDLPAVPFFLPYVHLSYRKVGAELQFAYVLASLSFFYRFDV